MTWAIWIAWGATAINAVTFVYGYWLTRALWRLQDQEMEELRELRAVLTVLHFLAVQSFMNCHRPVFKAWSATLGVPLRIKILTSDRGRDDEDES
jgi:hypothetical protein